MSDPLEDRYLDIRWSAVTSILYHERLAQRYDRFNRWVVFGSLLFSLVAGVSFFGAFGIVTQTTVKTIGVTASCVVFFCTALSMAFNFIEKAHQHSNLARSWKDIEYQAETIWKKGDLDALVAQFERLEFLLANLKKEEPPTGRRLAAWSELNASRRLGLSDPSVGWFMRWLRHF